MMGGGGVRRMGAGARMGGPALPAERTKDFNGTMRRPLQRLRLESVPLVLALTCGVISVAFLVTGPKILGDATNVLFNGVVGKELPAGISKDQALALLRAHGEGQPADMLSTMNADPRVLPGPRCQITAPRRAYPRS
ncbi:MAG: hypothetical protein ACREOE_01600 [Gemmatimonadales bacterium]